MSILGSLNQDEEDTAPKPILVKQDWSGYQEVWDGVQGEGCKKMRFKAEYLSCKLKLHAAVAILHYSV